MSGGGEVKLEDIDQDVLIRCRRCDLTENRDPLGTCFAHVVKKKYGSQGVWCWSCECMFWEYHETPRLVPSWPPAGRHCLDGQPPTYLGGYILDATLPEHRQHGRPRCSDMIPVDELFMSRVTCLDAPTGSGKTFMLVEFCKKYPDRPVLVCVAWRSLCYYYKSLMEEHTGKSWELYCEVNKGKVQLWNPSKNSRVIVCYPSLCMLDLDMSLQFREGWGLWLDECVSLSHFSAQTAIMSTEVMLKWCDRTLTALLRVAPWCVMAQYNMRIDSPEWILQRLCMNVQQAVAEGVLRTICISEELLWKSKTFLYTHYESNLLAALRAATLSGYSDVPGRSHNAPVYCVVNYASKAELVACWLRGEARDYLFDKGWDLEDVTQTLARIRVVTADMKQVSNEAGAYARHFFRDPQVHAKDVDVLITTYVIESGVSMPVHFKSLFAVLYKNIANWDSQFQALCRIREENVPICAFLQKGIRGVGLGVKSRGEIAETIQNTFVG